MTERINVLMQEIASLQESKLVFLTYEEKPGEWSELVRIADEQINRRLKEIEELKNA